MTIAEKITRAKADYDEVYTAGYEKGKSEGGGDNHYDTFWDLYQQNGNRSDYLRAFAGVGWTDKTFKPKYSIRPNNANAMFSFSKIKNLKKLLSDLNIELDFSGVTYGRFVQMIESSSVTDVGIIDMTGSAGQTVSYFLYNALSLKNVDKIILPNNGSLELQKTCFQSCSNLAEIRFEGVHGKNGLDLHWSTKLSKESIESVINVLSTTTNGLTVTLSKTAVNNAFAGENLLQIMPNTNTSGNSKTNTQYVSMTTKGVVCGIAQIEGGKQYTIKRNIAGKEWRYFYYDTYPLDTGAVSIDGIYFTGTYAENLSSTFTAPDNAKYVVVRGAEGLTEEEMQNFELTCGVAGSESPEWLNLIATKPNWTISLS
jgi:hypothetical protein